MFAKTHKFLLDIGFKNKETPSKLQVIEGVFTCADKKRGGFSFRFGFRISISEQLLWARSNPSVRW